MSDISAILTRLVQAMTTDKDAVSVTCSLSPTAGATIVRVQLSSRDIGKVIGRQGRIAQSLRVILTAIGSEQKTTYKLDIAESPGNINEEPA